MNILAAIIFAFWLLVLVQTILNLLLVPRLSAGEPSGGLKPAAPWPFVSIVIPARNESRTIEATVRAFLAQDYPQFEVIVVDDRSTDGTGELVRRIGDPRVTVIDGEETPAGWLGKPWALDQGSRRARGEVILAVDADIIYSPPAVRAAVGELMAGGVSLLSLLPNFEMHGFGENVGMPMMAFTGFAAMPLWISNRSGVRWLGIGAGSGNLITRNALREIDYFTSLRTEVVDDVMLAWRVRGHGGKTITWRADQLISVRMYHGAREIVEGFTKNAFSIVRRSYLGLLVALVLIALFHLLPYGLAFRGNLLGVGAVVAITVVRLLIFRSLRYRLDSAIFLHPLMVLFWSYIFLRSAWITGVRNELRWRGRTYEARR